MKLERKQMVGIISIITIILILAVLIISIVVNPMKNTNDAEIARTMEYPRVQNGEDQTDSEFVKFDAFFLRDLDGDNIADKVRGTCREVGQSDTLYMELNVLTNGQLKNGKITINNNKNYYLQTALIKDTVIKENYIGSNTRQIELNDMVNGTQKLLQGIVRSGDYSYTSKRYAAIGNDTTKYSKINSVTLTGTHVSDTGEETPIEKTVEFNVDWHGTTNTIITNIRQTKNLNEVIDEENNELKLKFTIDVREENEQLLLKKSYIEGTLPELNGYNPSKVEVTGIGVAYTYNENTKRFTAQREAILNEQGIVTTSASTNARNTYEVQVTYPLEAFTELGEDTIEYKVPVKAYYEGYNNTNKEFKNPYKSNIAQDTYVITFRNPQGSKAIFDVSIGKYVSYPYSRYMISKQKPLNIYNGIKETEKDDTYTVSWKAYTGTLEQSQKIIMKETQGEGQKISDNFIKSDTNTQSMENITKFVGIYFSDPVKLLGENGEIKVYDDQTNQLLETFNKSNWYKYTSEKPYKYEEPVEHIRVETSNANSESSIYVYHVKELDDKKITETYTQGEFENLRYINTTLAGYIGGEHVNTDIAEARYEEPISVASIRISKSTMTTQETQKNIVMKIKTEERDNLVKWINGSFLVKLPQGIIGVDINKIQIDNTNVEITSYEKYEKDGNIYIKINTENEQEASYTITIDCNITPDPRIVTKTENIELYASNENNQNYYYNANDIYDVNNNLNTEEQVNIWQISISFISPDSLLTSQTASNYDEKGSIAIAPQIAYVSKEQRKSNITVEINNNYASTISEVKIIGKIPTIGNTYVINGNDMGSEFNTTMSNTGIILPQQLQEIATVYYTTVENPSKDLEDEKNGWETEPQDFSQVKSYMVDLGDKVLKRGEKHQINYEINIPEGINYNQVSYSHHAIYFSLDTNEGKYRTQTEPNKLGFMIVKEYDLELTKYHKNKEKIVSGATYSIQEEGNEEVITRVTNQQGKLVFPRLYIDRVYTIKEIKSPSSYELNEDEVKFIAREENGQLKIEKISGNVKNISNGNAGENIAQIEVEDEVRANLRIQKTKQGTETGLKNIKYKITGKGISSSGRILITNANGEADLKGLYLGQEYTLEEVKAEGYYISNPIKFVINSNDGNYTPNIIQGEIKANSITIQDEIPTLNLNIENEKIPEYNLVINKVEKGKTTPIVGAKFALYKGTERIQTFITNEQGQITVSGLYQYVEEKQIEQTYTLKEIAAPEGYAKVDNITFYADMQEGVLNMHITAGEVKDIISGENTITVTVEDSPTFKLIKQDGTTKEFLADVKFAIYNEETGKPATDNKGNIIGTRERINGTTYYVVTTDEKGEITANLPQGLYRAEEIETHEKYALGTKQENSHYFGIDKSKEIKTRISDTSKRMEHDDFYDIHAISNTSDGGYVIGAQKHWNNDGAVLIKYNEADQEEWKKVMGDEIENKIENIVEIKDGGLIIEGIFNPEKLQLGNYIPERTGKSIRMLLKCSSSGEVQWGTSIKDYITQVNKIISTNDGGYIAVGNHSLGDSTEGIIIKYNENNEIQWTQKVGTTVKSVAEINSEEYIVVGEFNEKEIQVGQYVLQNEGNTNSMIIKYNNIGEVKWATAIRGEENNTLSAVAKFGDGGYIVGGTFESDNIQIGDQEFVRQGFHDIMLISYNKDNEVEKAISIKGNLENAVKTIISTKDGGYLIGAEGLRNVEIEGIFYRGTYETLYSNVALIKYDKEGKIEWIEGDIDIDQTNYSIYGIVQVNAQKYVVAGKFMFSYGGYGEDRELYILKEITVEPEIPQTQEITVDNYLKQLKITTEVEVINEIKGGSITGEGETPYEIVEYGNNNTKEIKMTPDEGYEITKITINGEKVDFNREEDGTYILPQLTNITEDMHIIVTYTALEQKKPEIIVHHYQKGTTNRVAEDEIYTGEEGEDYTTKPRTDLEKYELAKDENGEYIIPSNAVGKYKKETQEIIYEYENKKVLLTVHHYLEGTTTKVTMPDGTEAQDVVQQGIEGTTYTTAPVVPDSKYELVSIPENSTGTYESPEVIVTYYYRGAPVPGVIVHHIDIDTKEKLAEDEVVPIDKSGRYGDTYTTIANSNVLENYEFVSKTDNWQGIMNEELIEVTYEYRIKYDLTITKYKAGTTEVIQGVMFNLKGDGISEEGKDYSTNPEGKVTLLDLKLGVIYTLQEVYTTKEYVLNEEPIVFKIVRAENNELQIQLQNGILKSNEIEPIIKGNRAQVNFAIENEPKYELEIEKYKKNTTEGIIGVTFNLKGEGLVSDGKNYTTDRQGKIKINGLIPEKEYTLQEIRTNLDYMIDEQIIKFKTHRENGELKAEIIEGIGKNINVTQAVEGTVPKVQLQIENEPKYNIQITKYETGTNTIIPKVEFIVKGKNMEEAGTKYTTNGNGIATISRLEQGEVYTIKETYAKGYYVDETEFTVKVDRVGDELQLEYNGRVAKQTPTIVQEENKQPVVKIDLENANIPKYTLELTKIGEKTGNLLQGAQFEITGAGRDLIAEKQYETGENGIIVIENLYENEEYTLTEVLAPIGYKVTETPVKFKAVQENNVWTLQTTSGNFFGETTIQDSKIRVVWEDEVLLKLQKIDEETGEPLQGAKFTIQDLEGNNAKDVNGNEVGTIENINGTDMRVVTSNENGMVVAEIAPGLYQATEVQAPFGYELPENPVQYFGIDESNKGEWEGVIENTISIEGDRPDIIINSIKSTTDKGCIVMGGYWVDPYYNTTVKIGDEKCPSAGGVMVGFIIKYNKNFEVEWSDFIEANTVECISIEEVEEGKYNAKIKFYGNIVLDKEYFSNIYALEANIIYNKKGEMEQVNVKDYAIKKEITTSDGGHVELIQTVGDINIAGKEFQDSKYIIIKYAENGEIEWANKSLYYSDTILREEIDGGYIVKAKAEESIELEHKVYENSGDVVVKYTRDGEIEKIITLGIKSSTINLIQRTNDEGYIIGANFVGKSIVLENGQKIESDETSNGIIVKYTKENSIEWASLINGGIKINAIKETDEDGYIVSAEFRTTIKIDGQEFTNIDDGDDTIIIRYTRDGNVKWKSQVYIDVDKYYMYTYSNVLIPIGNEEYIMRNLSGNQIGDKKCEEVSGNFMRIKYMQDGNVECINKVVDRVKYNGSVSGYIQIEFSGTIRVQNKEITSKNSTDRLLIGITNNEMQFVTVIDGNNHNLYVTYEGMSDGGIILIENSTLSNNKQIVKLAPDKKVEWVTEIQEDKKYNFDNIKEISDGGVILTETYCQYSGSTSFSNKKIIKINVYGKIEWETQTEENKYMEITRVKETSDGEYIIVERR